jgi:hypothetical protein
MYLQSTSVKKRKAELYDEMWEASLPMIDAALKRLKTNKSKGTTVASNKTLRKDIYVENIFSMAGGNLYADGFKITIKRLEGCVFDVKGKIKFRTYDEFADVPDFFEAIPDGENGQGKVELKGGKPYQIVDTWEEDFSQGLRFPR